MESGAQPAAPDYWQSASPIGTPVSAVVELSDLYHAPETYDVKITVLQVRRGAPAAHLLKKADLSGPTPPDGLELLLAQVRFEFAARGAPGDKTWEVSEKQFSAFSAQGKPYEHFSVGAPEPLLRGVLRSGESLVGWLGFVIPKEDRQPLLTFVPASIWLRLFP